MTEKVGSSKKRIVVLVLWILLTYFYSSVAYAYITASNQDKKLEEYLQYTVVLCGDDHRPTKEVRSLVLIRADQLHLPLQANQVNVSGYGPTLKIAVNYFVDINMPVFPRSIYRKEFQHEAIYRNIR